MITNFESPQATTFHKQVTTNVAAVLKVTTFHNHDRMGGMLPTWNWKEQYFFYINHVHVVYHPYQEPLILHFLFHSTVQNKS